MSIFHDICISLTYDFLLLLYMTLFHFGNNLFFSLILMTKQFKGRPFDLPE